MGAISSRLSTWGHHEVTPKLIDRETGKEIDKPMPWHGEAELGIFYHDWLGQLWLWTFIVRIYFRWRGKINGWMYDKPRSAKDIQKFIKEYQVNMHEIEKPVEEYHTLNEFFTRHLKHDARPVAEPNNPAVAVSPADSRVLVFDSVSQAKEMWIKGKGFNIAKLLGSRHNSADWEGCSLIINRLSPVDYHRLHSPASGTIKSISWAGYTLYAVEGAAINNPIDVYGSNERAIVEIETPAFGTVAFCIIGASQVGSCNMSVKEGTTIQKGQEIAYFSYGGSATVTLFKKDRLKWDDDLRANSHRLWETKCKVGQSTGQATQFREE